MSNNDSEVTITSLENHFANAKIKAESTHVAPKILFEDQLLNLFNNAQVSSKREEDNSGNYEYHKYTDSFIYKAKYDSIRLWDATYAVSEQDFEDGIVNAFISHAPYLKSQERYYAFHESFESVIFKVMKYEYNDKEKQEKNFSYFKALIRAMNRIIEHPDNHYPKSSFKLLILNQIDYRTITNVKTGNIKEMLVFFKDNLTKEKGVALKSEYKEDRLTHYAFINYLTILTKFNNDQNELKDLLWEEFAVTNKKERNYELKHIMCKYTLSKIDFTVLDKQILVDKIGVDYLMAMRALLSGKSKIKDGLTVFLDTLTNEDQKKEMFLKSLFEKEFLSKYVTVEKKYFPDIIDKITNEDIQKIMTFYKSYAVSYWKKFYTDKDSFVAKELKEDLKVFQETKNNDSNFLNKLSEKIYMAISTHIAKLQKKSLNKSLKEEGVVLKKPSKIPKKRL